MKHIQQCPVRLYVEHMLRAWMQDNVSQRWSIGLLFSGKKIVHFIVLLVEAHIMRYLEMTQELE